MSGADLSGGCQCGAVRYVLRGGLKFRPYACHCTACQAQTGSAFSLHVLASWDDLEVTGPCIEGQHVKPDGATLSIFACERCFSRIHSRNHRRPDVIALRLGTLDDTSGVVPAFHLWVRSKQPWVQLPDGVPAYEQQVSDPDEWQRLVTVAR